LPVTRAAADSSVSGVGFISTRPATFSPATISISFHQIAA